MKVLDERAFDKPSKEDEEKAHSILLLSILYGVLHEVTAEEINAGL